MRLAAGLGGPVEQAELATAEAEYARATRGERRLERRGARLGGGRAALSGRYARWREAESLAAARERDEAEIVARPRSRPLAGWAATGWPWSWSRWPLARGCAWWTTRSWPPRTEADEDDDPFGLTERERQVLELVSAGATNREIGEQLHMAEKTASVHVSRILTKLDVRSRTEAAAVAHRHGMAPTI